MGYKSIENKPPHLVFHGEVTPNISLDFFLAGSTCFLEVGTMFAFSSLSKIMLIDNSYCLKVTLVLTLLSFLK